MLLLMLAGATGCGSAKTTTTASVVPWVNRPLPFYVVPEAKLVHYQTSGPLCLAHQLRVSEGRGGVGLGNQLERLVFTNVGAGSCLLRGYPTIRAVAPDGRRLTLRPQRGGTYFGRLIPATLPAGGRVFLDFGTSSGCDSGRKRAVRFRHLVFVLPQGGEVRAGDLSLSEVCGLSMSEFGLPVRYEQPRPAPGTPGTLQARVLLPPDVRAGTTLRYTVVLSNTTGTTVVLRPCPGYSEGLYASGTKVRRAFSLNCDAVHEIRAHTHVRYAMRIAVPRRVGVTKLGWYLNTPNGPFAGGVVQIV